MMTIDKFKEAIEHLRGWANSVELTLLPFNAAYMHRLADALELEFWDRQAADRFKPTDEVLITTIKGIREKTACDWESIYTLLQAWLLERKLQDMTHTHEKRIADRWRFCTAHGFPLPYVGGGYVMHVGKRRVHGATPDECATLAMGQTTPLVETVFDAQARLRDAIRNSTKY